jgi:AcrR family transcriptional regulator
VAEIARRSGIGKGSVYLFFESKAALFMAVAEVVETEVRNAYLRESRKRRLRTARERLAHLLAFHVEALDRDPFLKVALDPEETASLFREMPLAVAQAHQGADVEFFEDLLETWSEEGAAHTIDPRVLTAVLRALYVVLLHRELVGDDSIERVLDLLGEGVASTLTRH